MVEIIKAKILIADNDKKNLDHMTELLEATNYTFEIVKNGFEVLQKTKEFSPDLIFLNSKISDVDGFEICRKLKENKSTQHIPVVLMTEAAESYPKIKGLSVGANDFITKPVDRTELTVRIENLLRIKDFEDFLNKHNELLEKEVLERTKELKNTLSKLNGSRQELQVSYIESVHRLSIMAEYRDEDTAAHIIRIGHYSKIIADHLGWPEESQETILFAMPLHDIGKIGIPSDILLKPKALTAEEFALMKTHTTIGAKILYKTKSKYLQMAEKISLTHHEKWDGSGYPQGLKGEEIPIEGRIGIIVDQYDSLRITRPYRPGFDHAKTVEIITKGDGRTLPEHFDLKILQAFKERHEEFDTIFELNKEVDLHI